LHKTLPNFQCRNSMPEFIHQNRLIKKEIFNDTLNLRIGIVRNCAIEPEVNYSINGDSLFLSIENISTIWEGCVCCFELEIKIAEIKDTNFITFIENEQIRKQNNKYIFPSLSQIESNGPINQVNSDGQKIGLWYYYSDDSIRVTSKSYYFIDDAGISRYKWEVVFDEEGQIDTICAFTGVDNEGISNVTCIRKDQYLVLDIE